MATVGRLAGALLAVSEDKTYLIGDLKEPLHFGEAGFEDPGERDIKSNPITRLTLRGGDERHGAVMGGDVFRLDLEGEELTALLAHFFLIRRNGIVSERLWRLVMESSKPESETSVAKSSVQEMGSEQQVGSEQKRRVVDARWLATTPWPVWEAVRDAVLRC